MNRNVIASEEGVAASIIARVYPIRRFFFPPSIPGEYRSNFTHLYMDIGWFGILSGSYSSIFNASPLLVVWENDEIGQFFSRLFGRKGEARA